MNEQNDIADLVLTNATIYTLDHNDSFASTVAIKNNSIIYVGDNEGVSSYIGVNTKVIDVEKRTILPGFCDAHCHGVMGGRLMNGCLLTHGATKEDYLKIIQEYLTTHIQDPYIFGFGWIHSAFPTQGPSKEILDSILSDIPAYFLSIDYHSCWVNSKALEIAGITKHTEDPAGGHIERHPDSREPWGCLREMSAIRLITTTLPQPTKEDWKAAIRTYMKKAAENGITSLFDAGVLNSNQWTAFQAAHELDEEGELTIHLYESFVCDPEQGVNQVPEVVKARNTFSNGNNFHVGVAKIFMDGAVEGHTGFLLEPYVDRDNYRGAPVWNLQTYKETAAALDKEGIQIHVHAIGGGATRDALDGIEYANLKNGGRDARHTIAHLERAIEEDIKRFRSLGVIACFQPAWFYMDDNYYQETIPLLGTHRANRRYLIEDFLKYDTTVSFGSDWPWGTVSSTMDPLIAIGTAVTRKDPDNPNEVSYEPKQRLHLKSAIRFHCYGGAVQNFMDKTIGSIKVGKQADLVVLNENIFKEQAVQLDKTMVDLTIFQGAIIYQRETKKLLQQPA